MNAADRNLIRIVLPPLLGLGLVVALTHPLDGTANENPTRPAGAVTPQHQDGIAP